MFTAFLIKYAEIGIKGRNRYLFEDALVHQIKYALKKCDGQFLIHKTQGRIYVDAQSEFDFVCQERFIIHLDILRNFCKLFIFKTVNFDIEIYYSFLKINNLLKT